MNQPAVLLIGDTSRAEFRTARRSLVETSCLEEAADCTAAVEIVRHRDASPDVIVVAQAYPGQHAAAEIDRLRRLAPLARVVGLLGPWCEGETRTGRHLPASMRVYWHQWLPRWHRELDRLHSGRCPGWGLPLTASEEERVLASLPEPLERRAGRVGVMSRNAAAAEWIVAALCVRGYEAFWLRSLQPPGVAAAVFDGSDGRGGEYDDLCRLAVALDGGPVVVLLDFPRQADLEALAPLAAAVLGKPVLLEDLFRQLDQVVETAR